VEKILRQMFIYIDFSTSFIHLNIFQPAHDNFPIQSGVKHGDALSPLLSIFAPFSLGYLMKAKNSYQWFFCYVKTLTGDPIISYVLLVLT
jgi:hypothetical protein